MDKSAFLPPPDTGSSDSTPFNPVLHEGLAALVVQQVATAPVVAVEASAPEGGETAEDVLAGAVAASPESAPAVEVAPPPRPPKVHRGKGPARAQVTATAAPTATAKKEEKVTGEVRLTLLPLLTLSGEELARSTKEVLAEGRNPTFTFFLKGAGRVVMGVMPVMGKSIMLTVVGGEGWLFTEFPMATTFTLDEVRHYVKPSGDAKRLALVANFRGVLQKLLATQLESLSEKLTDCQGRSRT